MCNLDNFIHPHHIDKGCTHCHEMLQLNTRFSWLNRLFKLINQFSYFWIMLFSNVILLVVLNFFIKNNSFLEFFFNDRSIPFLIIGSFAMVLLFPKFFVGFIREIKQRTIGLMTLVSFSAFVAYTLSLGLLISNYSINTTYELHFEEGVAILTFLSIGVAFESRIRHQGDYDIYDILKYNHKDITKWKKFNIKNPAKVGDIIAIEKNTPILVDGIVVEGQTYISDLSVVAPNQFIFKRKGMEVFAGFLNKGAKILIRVTQPLETCKLAKDIEKSKKINMSRLKINTLANKFTKYLLVIELLAAIATFSYKFWFLDLEITKTIVLTLTVFIIVCPCAIGILPSAILTISASILNRKKIFIRNNDVFNNQKKIKYMIFNDYQQSYGGKYIVRSWHGSNNALSILKAMVVESNSEKLKDILTYNIEVFPVANLKILLKEHDCLKANFNNKTYYLGNRMNKEVFGFNYDFQDNEWVLFENNKHLASFFYEEVGAQRLKKLIEILKKKNIASIHLKNSNQPSVNNTKVVFDKVISINNAEEKTTIINEYKSKGGVLLVNNEISEQELSVNAAKGDINVFVSSDFKKSSYYSDIDVFNDDLSTIHTFLNTIKIARRYIIWGILWAIFYNTIAFTLIIFFKIDPIIGAGVNMLSDFLIFFIIFTYSFFWIKNRRTNGRNKSKS